MNASLSASAPWSIVALLGAAVATAVEVVPWVMPERVALQECEWVCAETTVNHWDGRTCSCHPLPAPPVEGSP